MSQHVSDLFKRQDEMQEIKNTHILMLKSPLATPDAKRRSMRLTLHLVDDANIEARYCD
jgi:hypothetical protein